MNSRFFGDAKNSSKMLLKNLMDSVKECQNVYGKNKTLLATEKDIRVQRLCSCWESTLSHGLKTVSVFKNIVSGNLTVELPTASFWDFASQHLTAHEKERFSTLRYVYTDNGKVRALIRAALNERSMERYILMWLGDANGLSTYFESWALIRDNEASNLLPSIAAGLGSILFAITVDSSDLNVAPAAETILPRQNEIIIAVPTVSSSSERKSTTTKRPQIISFEDDENSTVLNNNAWASSTPPATMPLSHTCLKYQEKERLAKEKLKTLKTDSTYERIMNATDPMNTPIIVNATHSNETDLIKPESPTVIQIFDPSPSSSYDFKESDMSASKMSSCDNSSITSNTTSQSENSVQNLDSSQTPPPAPMSEDRPLEERPSEEENSSIGADNEDGDDDSKDLNSSNADVAMPETIPAISEAEEKYLQRIKELESRCTSLEEQVTTLTLENSRLKSVHHKLVMSRQCSKHFSVSIPRVLLQKRDTTKKKYYAYEIQIVPVDGGDSLKWTLLRRYSEFHRLHEFLQKSNAVIATLDFPPKKRFGNMNAEFVELRRQRLQIYLLGVLSLLPEIFKCKTRTQLENAFPFLNQSHQM